MATDPPTALSPFQIIAVNPQSLSVYASYIYTAFIYPGVPHSSLSIPLSYGTWAPFLSVSFGHPETLIHPTPKAKHEGGPSPVPSEAPFAQGANRFIQVAAPLTKLCQAEGSSVHGFFFPSSCHLLPCIIGFTLTFVLIFLAHFCFFLVKFALRRPPSRPTCYLPYLPPGQGMLTCSGRTTPEG